MESLAGKEGVKKYPDCFASRITVRRLGHFLLYRRGCRSSNGLVDVYSFAIIRSGFHTCESHTYPGRYHEPGVLPVNTITRPVVRIIRNRTQMLT